MLILFPLRLRQILVAELAKLRAELADGENSIGAFSEAQREIRRLQRENQSVSDQFEQVLFCASGKM